MPLTITEQLAHSTVRIETEGPNGSGCGTGFFYKFCEQPSGKFVPAIVTNKHVLETVTLARLVMSTRDADGNPVRGRMIPVELTLHHGAIIPHPDPSVDLCVCPVDGLFKMMEAAEHRFFFKSFGTSLLPTVEDLEGFSAVEDILMIGYPNGLWDSINNQPLIRKGVTATHPSIDFGGKKEFLIDCACFRGSSGSPVLLYSTGTRHERDGTVVFHTSIRVKLLGILWGIANQTASGEIVAITIPTTAAKAHMALTQIPMNLGFVIRSERLRDFEAILERRFKG